MFRYAQIDLTGKCITISALTKEITRDNLIRIGDNEDVQLGDIRIGSVWNRPSPPPPEPPQPSAQEQIDKLKEQLAITNQTVDFLLGI